MSEISDLATQNYNDLAVENIRIAARLRMAQAANQAVTETINQRISQHKANLAGWAEGETCWCIRTPSTGRDLVEMHRLLNHQPNPNCHACHGAGRINRGFLVPTEPDPEERAISRHDLIVAISELEIILKML